MGAPAFARQGFHLATQLAPKVAGAAASFLFLMFVARSSSVEAYGQAAFIISIAGFSASFSSLGQRFVVLRRVPGLLETQRINAGSVAATSSQIALLGAAATAVLVAVVISKLDMPAIDDLGALLLVLCAILVFSQGSLEFFSQLLRALGNGNLSIYIREVAPRVVALAMLAILALTSSGVLQLATIIAILTAGTALSLAAAVVVSRRQLLLSKSVSSISRAQLKEGIIFLPRIAAATAREYSDVLILGLVAPPSVVAVYFTLVRFSALLLLPGTALSTNAVVEITKIHAAGRQGQALSAARQLFMQSAAIVIPLAAIFWLFAPQLLGLFSITAAGNELAVFLVFLNGAVVGASLGIWELMQCLEGTRRFHIAFPVIVTTGAAAMYVSAITAGVVGLAAAYLVMNIAWIAFGLVELFRLGNQPPMKVA